MSANTNCDRCGKDTGRPCPSHGMKDAAIPDEVEIPTVRGGSKKLTRTKHVHLCASCIASLKDWFELFRKEKSGASSH